MVPIFKQIGLGAILGFLISGVVVNIMFSGQFSEHPEELLHISEFGVVLFLFVIGLELRPVDLWSMRKDIFGLGLLQVVVCGLLIATLSYFFAQPFNTSIVIGLAMSLSSTAMVMSILDEKRERNMPHGKKSFSILLFQDLAIVPLLLMVALLSPSGQENNGSSTLMSAAVAVMAIIILILAGKYLLDPIFRLLAKTKTQEIMTASALGVVIFAALLMDQAGMSYAMGAFIAGVMLAESSFRHEVEANIEPFRGLFLGLFFIAVGLSINLQVVINNWYIILMAAPLVMAIKTIGIYLVSRVTGNSHVVSVKTAFGLSQLGEFGFVMFGAAVTASIIDENLSSLLIAVISVSMALSPVYEKLSKFFISKESAESIDENFDGAGGQVLIIGFGRFGQIISQPLFSMGYEVVILDNDTHRVKDAGSYGFKVFYGDGTRRDILKAAEIGHCTAVVIATDNKSTTSLIVDQVKRMDLKIKIFARSFDRIHSIELYEKNVDYSVRETFESALELGKQVLIQLGNDEIMTERHVTDVRNLDKERLQYDVKGDYKTGVLKMHMEPKKS